MGIEPEPGGVFAGDGLALRGTGAGGEARVGDGSGDLGHGGHEKSLESGVGSPGRVCPVPM